jgi:NADH dehydrogenase
MSGSAFVVGAGGAVGEAVVAALVRRGWRVTASVRQRRVDAIARLERTGAKVTCADLADDVSWAVEAGGHDTLVFTTNLTLTAAALERLDNIASRIVAFSSNNVAADPHAETSRALAAAETAVRARAPRVAIVRPTLIYGDPRLPTMTRLLRIASTWPVSPMPGSGRARMQPVFHQDLGELAALLAAPNAPSGVFAAGGPDIVTLRELYGAIQRAVGRRSPIVSIPKSALPILSRWLTAEQIARVESDRIALPQDPLPSAWAPQVSLADGLSALFSAMQASAAERDGD